MLASIHMSATLRNAAPRAATHQIRYTDLAILGLLCATPLVLTPWGITRQMLTLVWNNDTYSHIPLIPLVSAVLIYLERREIFTSVSRGWGMGGALLGAGAIALIGARTFSWTTHPTNQLSLTMFGFVLFWIGAFAL